MKQAIFCVILICFSALVAQPVQLPVVEIQGEGQVRIPLAKRGALPFISSEVSDSLEHFIPNSLPAFRPLDSKINPPLKARFAGSLGTDWQLRLTGSVYGLDPVIPHLRLDLNQLYYPLQHRYLEHQLHALLMPESGLQLSTRVRHQYADAKSYRGSAFTWGFYHHADSLMDKSYSLTQLQTRVWWESSSQRSFGNSIRHNTPGLWHEHSIHKDKHHLTNSLGSSMGRFAFSSVYELPFEVKGLKHASAGLMSDMGHLWPRLQAHYEHTFRAGTVLWAGNYPALIPQTRASLLESYPWALQPRLGKAVLSPMDIRLGLTEELPYISKAIPGTGQKSPANRIGITFRSAFAYNRPVLRDTGLSRLPYLNLESMWENDISLNAQIRLPWVDISQDLSLQLRHLHHQNLIRAPYSSLVESHTAIGCKYDKLDARLSLDQFFCQEDHQGKNLPEAIDLSLNARYQLLAQLTLQAELLNVFNSRHLSWKGLPGTHREFRIGAGWLYR